MNHDLIIWALCLAAFGVLVIAIGAWKFLLAYLAVSIAVGCGYVLGAIMSANREG